MLCEDCQKRDATVHLAVVSWPSGEIIKHLCESCYPAFELTHTSQYAIDSPAPLPSNVERLTAKEYLEFSAKAAANGADKPVFKYVCEELKKLPVTRARLSVELLSLAWQSLKEGDDPYDLIGLGCCFANSIQTAQTEKCVELLEKIIVRSVESMEVSPKPPSAHPLGFGLTLAVIALRKIAEKRYAKLLAVLRNPTDGEINRRRSVMTYL